MATKNPTNNLPDDEVLLRVENLCQYFKSKSGKFENRAVDDVSFDVKKGEVFGLVGESGCGKTTTGRSIIRIYDITSGSIYFKGQRICAGTRAYQNEIKAQRQTIRDIKAEGAPDAEERVSACQRQIQELYAQIEAAKYDHKHSDHVYAQKLVAECDQKFAALLAQAGTSREKVDLKRQYKAERKLAKKTKLITKIQMIFQDPFSSLNPRMTVREIVSEGLVINGIKDREYIDQKVYEILELVGLVREHAGRYPHEFSGGQQQRIGIARAIIMNPDMIIADEPISALDVSIQAQVINLLNELREKLGLTILFIAHDLSVVKYFSDRIGVMYFGKMVELAPADELFEHPLHPYTRSLLSAIPRPDPDFEKVRKRVAYDPLAEHDYSVNQPSMRELTPGHFVYCNDQEALAYQKELGL
ncbi:MAG: ABC transporter ATP-binding protein [Clostridia bacterium]|nr:ABC transporter ATP-binding protein [Clostridia bacterium]